MKKILCRIFGHKYQFNFGWMPNRAHCTRCAKKWKTINNPDYIPGKSNPLEVDIQIWVEDKQQDNG